MSQLEREIAEIPARLRDVAGANRAALGEAVRRYQAAPPPALFTVARGTSDSVASYAAYRLTPALNLPVGSFAPSLASLEGVTVNRGGIWSLSISQSGRSPDIVAAQKAFAGSGGVRLALVNDVASPLAREADLVLGQAAGQENSVAATKSLACSLMLVDLLSEALAGTGSDAEQRCALEADAAARAMAAGIDLGSLVEATHAYVIGRGATLPVAAEAALKLKEAAGLHAEALSAAEVMHGPRAIAGHTLPVVGFAGAGSAGRSVAEALAALESQGSPTLLISCETLGVGDAPVGAIALIAAFYARLPDLCRRRGLDPDQPRSLSKITLTV